MVKTIAMSAKTIFEISAGGVVFRERERGHEVILVSTKGGKAWALPKGLVEKGESLEDTARREVKEETGVEAESLGRIDKIDYWFFWEDDEGKKRRHHKVVYFFLMRYKGGSTEEHDYEVEEVRWFPIEEAIKLASYRSEREILKKAKEMIEKL
jgi:8-oxo-dGTP diphosphatase